MAGGLTSSCSAFGFFLWASTRATLRNSTALSELVVNGFIDSIPLLLTLHFEDYALVDAVGVADITDGTVAEALDLLGSFVSRLPHSLEFLSWVHFAVCRVLVKALILIINDVNTLVC